MSGNLQKMLNVPCRQAAGEEDKRPILPAENFSVFFPLHFPCLRFRSE